MAPTAHLEPGVVQAYGAQAERDDRRRPLPERRPTSSAQRDRRRAARLAASALALSADVMRLKYAKLLLNLGNAVDALCGPGDSSDELVDARAEPRDGRPCDAAGIEFEAEEVDDVEGRWERIDVQDDRRPRARRVVELAEPGPRHRRDRDRLPQRRDRRCSAGCTGSRRRSTRRCARSPSATPARAAHPGAAARRTRSWRWPRERHRRPGDRRGGRDRRAGRAELGRARRHLLAVGRRRRGRARARRCAPRCCPRAHAIERPACSTPGSAPDLLATHRRARGERRLMLLGHVDTVIAHAAHQPLRPDGERLYGTGTADMKGGVVLALGVARALAQRPERSPSWPCCWSPTRSGGRRRSCTRRGSPATTPACASRPASARPTGEEGVVVRRKAAGTLRVLRHRPRRALGQRARPAGATRCWRWPQTARAVAALHDPRGPEQLSVVPDGDALRRGVQRRPRRRRADLRPARPAAGGVRAGARVRAGGARRRGARGRAMERRWPGMDSEAATAGAARRAPRRGSGRPIVGVPRGGASDASHFAGTIPLTVDGLGPRGGGAHTPEEFVLRDVAAPARRGRAGRSRSRSLHLPSSERQ